MISTPSKALERLRVEVARERVQSSGEAIERVAQSTGFRDPERMRRAFIRAFGHPPQSLRRFAWRSRTAQNNRRMRRRKVVRALGDLEHPGDLVEGEVLAQRVPAHDQVHLVRGIINLLE